MTTENKQPSQTNQPSGDAGNTIGTKMAHHLDDKVAEVLGQQHKDAGALDAMQSMQYAKMALAAGVPDVPGIARPTMEEMMGDKVGQRADPYAETKHHLRYALENIIKQEVYRHTVDLQSTLSRLQMILDGVCNERRDLSDKLDKVNAAGVDVYALSTFYETYRAVAGGNIAETADFLRAWDWKFLPDGVGWTHPDIGGALSMDEATGKILDGLQEKVELTRKTPQPENNHGNEETPNEEEDQEENKPDSNESCPDSGGPSSAGNEAV